MKRTPWFDGSVKPVKVGVYNTDAYLGNCFQYWNGRFWGGYASEPEVAACPSSSRFRSSFQTPKWRGLTKEAK